MESLKSWVTNGLAEEVSTSDCSKECPGDTLDRCGGTNTINVSVYKFAKRDDTNGKFCYTNT